MRKDLERRSVGLPAGLHAPIWRRHWPWMVMCALAIVALLCGYSGFAESLAAQGERPSHLTLLYLTIQLLVLQSGAVTGPIPWQLDLARFVAPVVAAWAVVQGLALLFRDELRGLRMRRARGHTVVCGLGERGLQLVRDFRRAGEQVVVVESDEGNDDISACEELGATVALGRAEDPALLAGVGADRARYVIAVCADDGTNVEVATSLHSLLADRSKESGPLVRCFVHMVDLRLCGLLRQHHMVTDDADPFGIRMFNVYENAARLLWQDHALERDMAGPDDPRPVRLVVVGMGQMGESVLIQAARIAHFANGKRLHATIIDREAGNRRSSLLRRYPSFEEVCEARFLELDVEGHAFAESSADWAGGDAITTVAVCFDEDSRSLTCALGLADHLRDPSAPVLVRMSREGGLASLLQTEGAARVGRPLRAFGAVSRSCSREVLLDEKLDAFARAIHDDYAARRRQGGGHPEDDPALRPWEDLDEALRESNRHQADHIPVKLRAVCCYSALPQPGKEEVRAFSEQEVEMLARMEHSRWNAERFLAGWRYGLERDTANRRSPYLVPWERLPDGIKEYDREAVRAIPALLALIGEKVYRSP